MTPPRRKKWTEAEERTLIDKYGEMVCDGTLAKMKTREKKYKPIASHVNSIHHVRDPISYPWQWSWKDVSTKVQNMRHQYSLVKQKIKKPDSPSSGGEEFDWVEGLTHWSNFLRYKEVFGDFAVQFNDSNLVANNGGGFDGNGHGMELGQFTQLDESGEGDFVTGIDGVSNGMMGLEFDYDGEGEENYNGNSNEHDSRLKEVVDNGFDYEEPDTMGCLVKKKRKIVKGFEKRAWGIVTNQLAQLREMEIQFENREVERDKERERRARLHTEQEQEREKKWEEMERKREEREKIRENTRRQRILEWEAMEKEIEERERRRREEEPIREREWEERMNRRRSEWKTRMDDSLGRHRAEMGQIQTRIFDEQQNITNQLLGLVSQWAGQPTGLADHTTASNHYLSQMMQNLHHVNGIVHDDSRVEGDNQDDQFIVDG